VAASLVVDHGSAVSSGAGRQFWKMSGSGNDFVFFDSRESGAAPDPLENTDDIVAICAQHVGVGADGVVFITSDDTAAFGIRYYNADGSRAALCGNASLCSAQSAVKLGLTALGERFQFRSDAGLIEALVDESAVASVRLAGVKQLERDARESLESGEERIGYAVVGVPHLVILVRDVAAVDVARRGRALRYGLERAPMGANVNFVSPVSALESAAAPEFSMRTYERGVEAETLACGTGSAAAAACIQAWNLAPSGGPIRLVTASGSTLEVRFPERNPGAWSELTGEGRFVYRGTLQELR
jgi:diaminopimelate epimerase